LAALEQAPVFFFRSPQLGFYDWGEGSILASRDADSSVFAGYKNHLEEIVRSRGLQPSIFLPKRGDLLIWHGALIHGGTPMLNPGLTRRSFICHYTSMASHKQASDSESAMVIALTCHPPCLTSLQCLAES
jgi:hypothetical protein